MLAIRIHHIGNRPLLPTEKMRETAWAIRPLRIKTSPLDMDDAEASDLTDTWHGRFSYPRTYQPTSFVARLRQSGESLFGTIEESGTRGAEAGQALRSFVCGRATAATVTFLKTYDHPTRVHKSVHYVGTVGDAGLEINGTWQIPGSWSGTFIMIRARGLPRGVTKREVERV